jgi:hypothetical protein
VSQSLLELGIKGQSSEKDRRSVRIITLANISAILTNLLYIIFYSLTDLSALLFPVLICAGSILCFTLSIFVNRYRLFETSKLLLTLTLTIEILLITIFSVGMVPGIHYYFILFAISPIVLWTHRDIGYILAIFILNTACFFLSNMFSTSTRRPYAGSLAEPCRISRSLPC